jgi:hypothetical protein
MNSYQYSKEIFVGYSNLSIYGKVLSYQSFGRELPVLEFF